MRFERLGKTYQLRIRDADDLAAVPELDEALWVATAAPVADFRCDSAFLGLVDTNGDGRIYTDEVKAAVRWLLERLDETSGVAEGADALPVASIRSDTPEGEMLRGAATVVLEEAEGTDVVSLEQTRTYLAGARDRPLNGDGVIVPEAAPEAETAEFVADAVACTGGTPDASGALGIGEAELERFINALGAHLEWKRQVQPAPDGAPTTPLLLGADTARAFRLYSTHEARVDLFFQQCRLALLGSREAAALRAQDWGLAQVDLSSAEEVEAHMQQASLAPASPDGVLPLDPGAINPAYREWVCRLKEEVLRPVLGRVGEGLSEEDWTRLKRFFAPYAQHLSATEGTEVASLAEEKLERYRDGPYAKRVRELIVADRQVSERLAEVRQLERVLLYQQNLMRLANNFVSFPELYNTKERALFEMGSALIDGRWFNFAVRVEDVASHSAVARASGAFVIYLEVSGGPDGEFHVALPATFGTKGNLAPGKRGVFFDIAQREYNARIVQIIENPISLREALLSPFRRLWDFIAGKVQGLSGPAQKQLQLSLKKTVSAAPQTGGEAAPAGSAQQPQAGPTPLAAGAGRTGALLGISVAIAALSSAFAFVVNTLSEKYHLIPFGLLGVAIVVMVPVGVLAFVNLLRQDLSALLEGCGWAVNARMRLNWQLRRSFTTPGRYPQEAQGTPRWRRLTIAELLLLIAALTIYILYVLSRLLVD